MGGGTPRFSSKLYRILENIFDVSGCCLFLALAFLWGALYLVIIILLSFFFSSYFFSLIKLGISVLWLIDWEISMLNIQ